MRSGTKRSATALALAAAAILTACSNTAKTSVTVSAASSLTEVTTAIENDWERSQPDTDVQLNIGGTTGLVAQIRNGAPADLLIAADATSLRPDEPAVRRQATLASNTIVAIVPADSRISTLADMTDPELRIAGCDPALPCGRLTAAALDELDTSITIDSLDPNVRLVRQRVLTGEADAGFVYATDTIDQPTIRRIELGSTQQAAVTVSLLTDERAAVELFEYIVTNEFVRSTLDELGFGPR